MLAQPGVRRYTIGALLPVIPEAPPVCAASLATPRWRLLSSRLPSLDDPEGEHLPATLPPVVDAHVHLFPPRLFEAIWGWFDEHGWPIRYRLHSPAVVDFLLARGVRHLVALMYAHKPGLARAMNAWMAELCRERPQVTGLATVFPGEPDAGAILSDAFAAGLRGVKLHCHVQCMPVDSERMAEIYDACVAHDRALVVHAGREPASPAYRCDPHTLCHVDRVEAVLRGWPDLRLCVPHLGADEYDAYGRLLERYDNLWLDTTMVVADYFPGVARHDLVSLRPERVLYGTDFPNLPYAWDREIHRLAARHPEEDLAQVLAGTAIELFRLDLLAP